MDSGEYILRLRLIGPVAVVLLVLLAVLLLGVIAGFRRGKGSKSMGGWVILVGASLMPIGDSMLLGSGMGDQGVSGFSCGLPFFSFGFLRDSPARRQRAKAEEIHWTVTAVVEVRLKDRAGPERQGGLP